MVKGPSLSFLKGNMKACVKYISNLHRRSAVYCVFPKNRSRRSEQRKVPSLCQETKCNHREWHDICREGPFEVFHNTGTAVQTRGHQCGTTVTKPSRWVPTREAWERRWWPTISKISLLRRKGLYPRLHPVISISLSPPMFYLLPRGSVTTSLQRVNHLGKWDRRY